MIDGKRSVEIEDENSLPYCIQGSAAPAFCGDSDTKTQLVCGNGCGSILIDRFISDDFIRLGIQCFVCGHVTRTPGLQDGEVLSSSVLNLGDKGTFLIGSTVNAKSGVIITCSQEIERTLRLTSPRTGNDSISLTAEGINELIRKYEEISGGKFDLQARIVKRDGNSSIHNYPFPWAVLTLQNALENRNINLRSPATLTALLWLNQFSHVYFKWVHHPRFSSVASDMAKPGSFIHTSSQLITAAYLAEAGNRIGLSLENEVGMPNPDLYIRTIGKEKIFLEVKAPRALQWADAVGANINQVEPAVRSALKKSRSQLNRSHRGVLVISSSFISPEISQTMEESARKALSAKGRDHRSVAALVSMNPVSVQITRDARFIADYHFSVQLNDHFDGENPISTGQAAA